MLLYDELVDGVGRDRYEHACQAAHRTAASTGRAVDGAPDWPDDLGDVPHELGDLWFGAGISMDDRLKAALRFLAEMPCYANTMYMQGFYAEMTSTQKALLWTAYREALEAPDPGPAAVIAYSLWVDFFETEDTSREAFAAVTAAGGHNWDRRIARVLSVAGPVPWHPKRQLIDSLIIEQRWHTAILTAVEGSLYDTYGQVEPDVTDILKRLQLPGSRAEIRRAQEAADRLSG